MGGNALKKLFAAPELNLVTHKAKSIPVLNPFDKYGRVFFFSWLGFFVAFMSWYAFPPLVSYSEKVPEQARTSTLTRIASHLVDRHNQARSQNDAGASRELEYRGPLGNVS
jgi:hypothetical protein